MSPPQEVLNQARYLLSRNGVLKGKTILVTAGGTREPIDPVRFVANRSSGKQGYAIAQEALNQGADVILISTPTVLPVPFGAELIPVQTAAEMEKAVLSNLNRADALVMSAAVADFRPTIAAEQKIKKNGELLELQLEPTTDILAEVGRQRNGYAQLKVVAGFAAESQNLIKNAQKKLSEKNLDWIFANDISTSQSGFEVDQNQGTILFRDGSSRQLSLTDKTAIAEVMVSLIADQIN